ncbi:MAG: hypothetical protein AAF456_07680 [Planctomycetota bacterium]
MASNKYFPYLCQEDAIQEYNTLRGEIVESQKQRVVLFRYSLGFIGVLLGFFFQDEILDSTEVLFLVAFSIPCALFSYSTRCRERRISSYIAVYLKNVSPWSRVSSPNTWLKFFQRSSTSIVLTLVLLDVCLIGTSIPKKWDTIESVNIFWLASTFVCFFMIVILIATTNLPNYRKVFEDALRRERDTISECEEGPAEPCSEGKK